MPDAAPPIIDLIIPARNEASNIDPLMQAIPWACLRRVIVADNGSTDGTAERAAARGATLVRQEEPGYGAACLAGLRLIQQRSDAGDPPPDAVAFLDADLADDPAQLPRLIATMFDRGADLVIGNRFRFAEPGSLDPHQRFGNWLACALIRLTTGKRYGDLGPMRLIRWPALQRINMQDRTWGWTVEMQFKAARHNMVVEQIDVPYRKRHSGKSKISGSLVGSARAGYKIIITIVRLWLSKT